MGDWPRQEPSESDPRVTLISNGHSWRWRCVCGASSGGRWYGSREEAEKKARHHSESHRSN